MRPFVALALMVILTAARAMAGKPPAKGMIKSPVAAMSTTGPPMEEVEVAELEAMKNQMAGLKEENAKLKAEIESDKHKN